MALTRNAKPEPFWISRIAAGQPARLRNPGESAEDYRVAMGWDAPWPPARAYCNAVTMSIRASTTPGWRLSPAVIGRYLLLDFGPPVVVSFCVPLGAWPKFQLDHPRRILSARVVGDLA